MSHALVAPPRAPHSAHAASSPVASGPRRTVVGVACLLACSALALAGCDNWPLFQHLPDPEPVIPEPVELVVNEDGSLGEDEIQDLGIVVPALEVEIRGTVDSCGFDPDSPTPVWPDHPIDDDGDGTVDRVGPWYAGWFDGDVDAYALTAEEAGWLSVELTWTNAPLSGENAPYRPAEEDGDWVDESDLDFVIFDYNGGALGPLLEDSGFTRDHPERTEQLLRLEFGDGAAVAVGCHHNVASSYTLRLSFGLP